MKLHRYHDIYPLRNVYQDWLKPHFKDGDFDLTFTFNPHYWNPDYNSKPDAISCGKHVRHYLNVINRGFYGHHYKRGRKQLKSAHFFELNQNLGFHVHMVLENPNDCQMNSKYRIQYLHNSWMKMKCSGVPEANLVRETKSVDAWINYITKDIKQSTIHMADVSNWFLGSININQIQLNK